MQNASQAASITVRQKTHPLANLFFNTITVPESEPAATPVTVKICGLTSAKDAACALEEGADYCGMIRHERSPRCITIEDARESCLTIDVGKRVFVDVNTPIESLKMYADFGFDKFQIHCEANVDLATVAAWSSIVGRENLWLAPRIAPDTPFPQELLDLADIFLVDTFQKSGAHGGSGKTGDWNRFREWSTRYAHKQFILAGGLNPDNLAAAIAESGANFVDLNSGLESAPGKKDHAKMHAALQIAKPNRGKPREAKGS